MPDPVGGPTSAPMESGTPSRLLRLRWPSAPRSWRLPAGEVQIRVALLDRSATGRHALARHLSAEELHRVDRLRRPGDRARRLVSRGLLREFLSGYLGVPPHEVSFRYGVNGKPALSGHRGEGRVRFNVSHSGALALFAFVRDVEVGVDVEALRPLSDLEAVAARFFSEAEIESLMGLPPERRELGFYNAWTRKEAFVKALGEGLSHPLRDFDVTLEPGEPARLLRLAHDDAGSERWSIVHLEPAPGYVGAVAVPAPGHRVRCWS